MDGGHGEPGDRLGSRIGRDDDIHPRCRKRTLAGPLTTGCYASRMPALSIAWYFSGVMRSTRLNITANEFASA